MNTSLLTLHERRLSFLAPRAFVSFSSENLLARHWALDSHNMWISFWGARQVVQRAFGCIGLRAVSKSLRRIFRNISDYFGGNVQRNGCGTILDNATGRHGRSPQARALNPANAD